MNVITVTIVLVTILAAGVSGIDLKYLDDSIDPCDDFYKFACGNFNKYHSRVDNEQTVGIFTLAEEELVRKGNELLSSPKRANDPVALKKVKAAYTACMDIEEQPYDEAPEIKIIEEFGMPLVDNKNIEKISWTEIGKIAGRFGVQQMFQFTVENFDPEDYIVIMFPDSWEEPSTIVPRVTKTYDEVLEESFKRQAKPQGRILEDPFDVFLKNISSKLQHKYNVFKSENELLKDLEPVKTFMKQLFSQEIIDDEITLPDDITTLADLQEWTDQQFGDEVDMNWVEYFQAHFDVAGVNITEDFVVYIVDTSSIYRILNLVKNTDPRVVKNFVLLRAFLFMAPDSDADTRYAAETYYKATGLKNYERWEYCSRKLLDVADSAGFSFAVAHDFVNYHFNINKIPKAAELIQNIREAFKTTVTNLDWLDADSRVKINKKLDNIIVYLGYPDFVDGKTSLDTFYENVRICEWDNYGNAQRMRAFKQAYAFSEFINHEFWGHSPFEVNAFAVRANDRIVAPLAMLGSDFLDGSNPLFDYSRIGNILAHEFVHHFDATGIGYNDLSQQVGWLPNSTLDSFETKKQCLIDQYSKFYAPEIDVYLDGSKTLNENMADNGGLRHALSAFKKYFWNYKIEHARYTIDQLFFINFATTWCSDDSIDYLSFLMKSNDHSPNRFRVLGTLSNMKEFAKAFNCPVGSNMNPENKCVVW